MRYIVATDGSEPSLKAAHFVVQQSFPGPEDEIFVIYVFPLPTDPECYEGIVALPTHADDERVTKVARPVLAETLKVLAEVEGTVYDVTLVGNPAQEVIQFATNLNVDLIIAGIRGRSPEKEPFLGSVSNALTHRAPCSVLIVR